MIKYVVTSIVIFMILITGGSNVEINSNLLIEETITPEYDYIKTLGPAVFDGLTEYELIEKINKSLNSDLSGKADLIVTSAIEKDVDPYLATAIILHETGCKWSCSTLLKQCNNVGGIKGTPGCNGGSYKSFSSLEEGIEYYINMLDKYYIQQGLTTPELINPKYAASTTWASQVNQYIYDIKNVK